MARMLAILALASASPVSASAGFSFASALDAADIASTALRVSEAELNTGSSGFSLGRPDKNYDGTAFNCTRIFLEPKSGDLHPHGLDNSIKARHGGAGGMLTVRAVYYEPRPVGIQNSLANDLYTTTYGHLHDRDLYIMRNVLKANAVRLAPWNSQLDHSEFLQKCQRYGLYVIPTFDLAYFMSAESRLRAYRLRQEEVWEGFQKFLSGARKDAGSDEDRFMMWSTNFGLNLNQTTENGPRSLSDLDAVRDEYFELLRIIRQAHWLHECGPQTKGCPGDRFKRPLAIPLMLDSKLRLDNLGWYIGFSETVWGTWPVDPQTMRIDRDTFNRLRPQGAFDVWIAQSMPPTSMPAQASLEQDVRWFNHTMKESHDEFVWHDLTTQTLENPNGDALPGCDASIGCTYPTQKLVLVQFGFAAEISYGSSVQARTEPGMQQQLMSSFWKRLGTFDTCAEAGAIIDEWADDWDRSGTMGCGGSAYQHPPTGPCDEEKPGRTIRHEWFGLNGQYTFLWMHCLDPRYHQEHPSSTCDDSLHGNSSASKNVIGACAFRFDNKTFASEKEIWDKLPGGFCARMRETGWLSIVNVALLILGLGLELLYSCGCFASKSKTHRSRPPPPLPTRSRQSRLASLEEGATIPEALNVEQSPGSSPFREEDNSLAVEIDLPIREELCEDKESSKVVLHVRAQVLRNGEVQFTRNQLQVHAMAHVHVQCERLARQVKAEAMAVIAENGWSAKEEEVKAATRLATINIHARVLEGYLVWLASQPNAEQKKKLDALLGERPLWMLFAEAALLRVMESLAEQTLHAPELMALFFDEARWRDSSNNSNASLPSPAQFTIDLDELHAGLQVLRQNTNPFTGGVNFDDMNDIGEARAKHSLETGRIGKTFLESSSWRVLFDVLDNFCPVVTVKCWVFFLAYYYHLGTMQTRSELASSFRPTPTQSDAIQVMALLDAALLFASELLRLWHGMGQRRLCYTPGRFRSQLKRSHRRWFRRRLVSMLVGFFGFAALMSIGGVGLHFCEVSDQVIADDTDCHDEQALFACAAYAALRVVIFIISTRQSGIPWVRGKLESLPELSSSIASSSGCESFCDSQASFRTSTEDDPAPLFEKKRRDWTPQFVWGIILLLCFGFEAWLVAPLVSGFTFSGFCGQSCTGRLNAVVFDLGGLELTLIPSECLACGGTISVIYLLVAMTAFLDLHFIFFLLIGVGGYIMGERRQLRSVLSSALRHLDLDASTQRPELRLGDLDPGLSDGQAMESVFGSAWRLLWSRIVESLHEDCMIPDGVANKMVSAARTLRWRDHKNSSAQFAVPSQKFTQIRFRATQLRGGSWQQAGETCCISALHVKHNARSTTAEIYPVPQSKSSVSRVTVNNAEEHAELMDSLDKTRLVVTRDIPHLNIQRGWQLIPSQGSSPSPSFTSTPSLRSWGRPKSPEKSTLQRSQSAGQHLLAMSASRSFPEEYKFIEPGEFCEFTADFSRKRRIHAISFSTTSENRCFDPVRWEVHASADGANWILLQTQANDFDSPVSRSTCVHTFFATEPWRCPQVTGPTLVDLRQVPPAVSERLCFFASSLRAILKQGQEGVRPGKDTLLECQSGAIPTLSQVVPVYGETVLLSEDFLCAHDGRNTNLGFLISQHEDQWEIFAHKQGMGSLQLFRDFTGGYIREKARKADRDGDVSRAAALQALLNEIRLWASLRSQTVAKTAAGAIKYHQVLELLPCIEDAPESSSEALESLVQLIIAHQTYGNKNQPEAADQDVRLLLQMYRKYPVFLVCDYDSRTARQSLKEQVDAWFQQKHHCNPGFRHASILLRYNTDYEVGQPDVNLVKVVEVLPRVYPLLLGELKPRPFSLSTQGKAANQLGALRFASGHYLQMMDANMGAFFGEACKVPYVLRLFQPPGSDRRTTQSRIIGFREFIFTGTQGAVGAAMADAEWTFGTICQRFLAGLGARMHYGHPDFFDAFWASNRGSVSKASPILNLSEDIFAGFNVIMRGEVSSHVDCLEWEKGREVSFNKASLFFTKVASGSVGVMRSRDLKILTENMNIVDSFSFYFASVGFYLYNLVTDMSMNLYVVIFVLLTLASKSLDDIGKLDSLLAAEWVVSFGSLAMFPRLMELILEYGLMEGLTRFVPSIPGAVAMFSFLNKSMAGAMYSTMRTGIATYISTGRPTANNHYSWKECYFLYKEDHYYPAIRLAILYLLYRQLAEGFSVAALPMLVLMGTACVWIIGPMLFCPQPTLWSIRDDLSEYWCFVIGANQSSFDRDRGSAKKVHLEEKLAAKVDDPQSNLYDVWLLDKLKHKRVPIKSRIVEFLAGAAFCCCLMSVVYASMVHQMFTVFFLVSVNYFLLAVWRILGRPTILMLLSTVFWICAIPWVLDSQSIGGQYGTLIVAAILTFQALRVLERGLLIAAWYLLRLNKRTLDCATLPESTQQEWDTKQSLIRRVEKYDAVVEYLYLSFMNYQWHLYVSVLIMAANSVAQVAMVALEMLGGIHSWWLLGFRLGRCGLRRREYEPPKSAEESSSSTSSMRFGGRQNLELQEMELNMRRPKPKVVE
eukprot:TRINITY_DN26670_c0_g1_i1.p1 TRINITY_DN26670_c0_g1~~TRINITY_DN26670_c0_g1_i1.p1  ORF type:complete len:2544 (-),score=362.33 TRINITY_DN26670_c0_g1_i1:96-7727(-)